MRRTIAILVATLLLIPGYAFSAYVSKGSLYKLMEVSGLNAQIGDMPAAITSGLEEAQSKKPVPIQMYETIREAAVEAFDPVYMRITIANQVRTGITEGDAIDVIAWLESPVGREIVAAEVASIKPGADAEKTAMAETLLANSRLVEQVRRIIELAQAEDLLLEIQKKGALATYSAVTTATGQNANIAAYERQIDAQIEQLRDATMKALTSSMAYTYRDIDPEKMDRYIAFLETPAAQRMNDSVLRGMRVAFIKAINNMAKAAATAAAAM